MADHETWCFQNPAARCCPTCRHEEVEEMVPATYEEPGEEGGRFCAREDNEQPGLGVGYRYLPLTGLNGKGQLNIARKCSGWEPKP